MGTSSRSSCTLKNPFQTFKSFTPIQLTTSTNKMKYAFVILVIAFAVATANGKTWKVINAKGKEAAEEALDAKGKAAAEEASIQKASPESKAADAAKEPAAVAA